MGGKPSAAALAAATKPTASGIDAISMDAMAAEPVLPAAEPPFPGVRFGMPHALVIIVCIAVAAILAPRDMSIRDILFLLGGSGAIGGSVVVMVMTGGRGADRVKRMVDAYRSSGN
ncbi:hypothetical protein ACFXKI_45020 [Streptomyces mirabilis]|uniref:hypothetical protein n=1 Tax=Streptomyces mirabilis TaxID=68239 RepID=UPI0036CB7819